MSFEGHETSPISETFGKDASFKLEQPIGSMSISPSGRDVVLGSKDGLHIIDLDSPYAPPRYLPHQTPWEVADVQWSPFASRDYWVASTSNQKALVWNLGAHSWRNSIEYVLHGHSRAITDINFSAFHPEILATCAVDSFVHCWDLRSPSKPAMSFSDWFAGATQVKWSRQDEHVVASSHDKFLYIWDDRKGAYPIRKIEAHGTKIYGIDWNRFEPSKIVTCSMDKTIKFWNTSNEEDQPERVIDTGFPVWRARHTPFGWGLMVMPQRGSGNLYLFDRRPVDGILQSGRTPPVHIFPGHKGQVKEFLWRTSGSVREGIDYRDFQLVTWGTDRELRLHEVPNDVLANVGYEKGVSKPQRLRITRKGARYRSFRDEPTDNAAAGESFSRTESFPSTQQFSRFRARLSTNVGMSRAPVTQFRGWLQSNRGNQKTGMHGRAATRPAADAISWMKNVKITSWNHDTLADEIKLVGDKFKRIDFEVVDISQRKITYSLQSPFGQNNTSIYLRVEMKFPKTYPREAQAVVHLQRSNALAQDLHKKLAHEVQEIATLCNENARGCIEATVRYLLRERSLEQLRSDLEKNSLTESKIIDAAAIPTDSSESSEDEDIKAVSGGHQLLNNVRVPPLTKDCAALWSDTGDLICFHAEKSNEPESLLSTLGTGRLDESDSSKLFGGFGKFLSDLQSRRPRSEEPSTSDDSGSVTSESSSSLASSASSSSSDSDRDDSRFPDDKLNPFTSTILDSLHRTKSADESYKSTNQPNARLGDTRPKMNVTVRIEDIVPAKRSLGKQYQITGDCVAVCRHNAKVAERASLSDEALVWELTALICDTKAASDLNNLVIEHKSLLDALARRVNHSSNSRKNNGIDVLQNLLSKESESLNLPHGFGHLIGRQYFIPVILSYFDQRADVQMLATLSCILILRQSELAQDEIYLWETHQQVNRLHDMKVSEELQPPKNFDKESAHASEKPSLEHSFSNLSSIATEFDIDQVRRRSIGSATQQLSNLNVLNDSRNSSHAPSVITEDPNGFVSALHSAIPSLSTSPENSRLTRRTESSSAFLGSKASLHALAKTFSSSPPSHIASASNVDIRHGSRSTQPGRSPDGSSFEEARSALRSSISLMNVSSRVGESQSMTQASQGGVTKSILKNRHAGSVQPVQHKKKLKSKLRNIGLFRTEDHFTCPLLAPAQYELCFGYIQSYITLLESWQLWTKRAEMLQIVALGRRQMQQSRQSNNKQDEQFEGLELRHCCISCGQILEPILKNMAVVGWHCVSSSCITSQRTSRTDQKCSICEVIVRGLSVPCLQCGHLTCLDCGQYWFNPEFNSVSLQSRSQSVASTRSIVPSDKDNVMTCPTGCGCLCAKMQDFTMVRTPVSGTFTNNSAPLQSDTSERSGSHLNSASSIGKGAWRGKYSTDADSAFNSLLAINISRSRSVSTAKTDQKAEGTSVVAVNDDDELLPWASHKLASLNRGSGAGLSRGLDARGGNATTSRP